MSPTPLSWAAGLALGAAGFGTAFALMPDATAEHTIATNDRVASAVAQLRRTHLYIGPEDRWRFSDSEVSQLQTALAHQRVPTYLAYWDTGNGDWGVTIGPEAVDAMMSAIGRRGYYFSGDSSTGNVSGDGIGYRAPYLDELDNPAQPGPSLLTLLHQVNEADPEPPWDDDSSGGGIAGAIVGGVGLGVAGAGVAGVLLWIVGRMRRAFG
jgi:hypothetical protein